MLLLDKEIKPVEKRVKRISYGVPSYKHNSKLANKLFVNDKKLKEKKTLDSKKINNTQEKFFRVYKSKEYLNLHRYGSVLGKIKEYYKIQKDFLVIRVKKSTSTTKCGLIRNVTQLKAVWKESIRLEFSNITEYPMKIYVKNILINLFFSKKNKYCKTSYNNKNIQNNEVSRYK